MLDAFEIAERLVPELVETVEVAGHLTREAALLTGLRAGTPVIAGGSDQTMAALALGADRPGRVAVALSSGGTVITPIDSPRADPRVHTLCHAHKGQWLMMGATLAAGLSLSWAAENLFMAPPAGDGPRTLVDAEQLSRWAGEIAAGADGLFFAPYLNGDRTPHMDSNARGCFIGLTLSHTPAHMARAIMEGVAYSLVESTEIFREIGLPVDEVSCYAGGSKSRIWRQILADVLGVPVRWRQFADYSALGAAVVGARGLGVVIPEEDIHGRAEQALLPVPGNARIYRSRLSTFKKIYRQLRDIFREISGFPQ
jgi:xylulokinase